MKKAFMWSGIVLTVAAVGLGCTRMFGDDIKKKTEQIISRFKGGNPGTGEAATAT